MRYFFAVLTAVSLSLLLSAQVWAGYKIILKNGKEIEAETFVIENSRITLKYGVGEASFPMSKVLAITDQNWKGDFLSGPAKQAAKPAEPRKQAQDFRATQPLTTAAPRKEVQQPLSQAKEQALPPAQADPQTGLPGVIGDDQRDDGEDQDLEPLPEDEDLPPEELP